MVADVVIIEFETQEEAQYALKSIKDFAGHGCGFEKWDIEKESPEGTWYFSHTGGDIRASGWSVPENANVIEMPEEWLNNGE